MNEKLYSVSETTERAGYCRSTLLNLERQGVVEPVRLGPNRTRFYTEDHIANIEAHKQKIHGK